MSATIDQPRKANQSKAESSGYKTPQVKVKQEANIQLKQSKAVKKLVKCELHEIRASERNKPLKRRQATRASKAQLVRLTKQCKQASKENKEASERVFSYQGTRLVNRKEEGRDPKSCFKIAQNRICNSSAFLSYQVWHMMLKLQHHIGLKF